MCADRLYLDALAQQGAKALTGLLGDEQSRREAEVDCRELASDVRANGTHHALQRLRREAVRDDAFLRVLMSKATKCATSAGIAASMLCSASNVMLQPCALMLAILVLVPSKAPSASPACF